MTTILNEAKGKKQGEGGTLVIISQSLLTLQTLPLLDGGSVGVQCDGAAAQPLHRGLEGTVGACRHLVEHECHQFALRHRHWRQEWW